MEIEEVSSARQITEILEKEKRQKLLERQSKENKLKLNAKETAEAMSKILDDLSLKIQKENQVQLETTFRRNKRLSAHYLCLNSARHFGNEFYTLRIFRTIRTKS